MAKTETQSLISNVKEKVENFKAAREELIKAQTELKEVLSEGVNLSKEIDSILELSEDIRETEKSEDVKPEEIKETKVEKVKETPKPKVEKQSKTDEPTETKSVKKEKVTAEENKESDGFDDFFEGLDGLGLDDNISDDIDNLGF